MIFGGQTVALVTVAQTGAPGYLGMTSEQRTVVPLPAVRFRQLSGEEAAEYATNTTTEVWKCTAPPGSEALAAASTGELVYDGTDHPELLDLDSDEGRAATFQIDGPIAPKYRRGGTVHHVTIIAKRETG